MVLRGHRNFAKILNAVRFFVVLHSRSRCAKNFAKFPLSDLVVLVLSLQHVGTTKTFPIFKIGRPL